MAFNFHYDVFLFQKQEVLQEGKWLRNAEALNAPGVVKQRLYRWLS